VARWRVNFPWSAREAGVITPPDGSAKAQSECMKSVIALLLLATPAFADSVVELEPTCVTADSPEARLLLVRVLESQEQLVVESGCTETIELTQEVVGDGIAVHLKSSRAVRSEVVDPRAAMREVYARLAQSLRERVAVEPAPTVLHEEPVAYEPAVESAPDVETPPSVPRTKLLYATAGVSSIGTAYSLGIRFGVKTQFDLSFFGAGSDTDKTASMRFHLLRYNESLYWGGGISFGTTNTHDDNGMEVSNDGMALDATGGLRLSERWFLESNLTIPEYDGPAVISASIGVGF
jgi:hypothetical protein